MSDTFEFIDAEYAASRTSSSSGSMTPSIVLMCVWSGVTRSGFYEWRDRPDSATVRRRDDLKQLITVSFEESDGTYGYRRVHADLADLGIACGLELVRSLMRELGLEPCQPRPWRQCLTESDGREHRIPDLVERDFTAPAPGVKMVGDITYIPTWQGWLYLATVIDCHTREVIGWAMDDHYRTPLIESAITMAVRNHQIEQDAVFHSDRGSNPGFRFTTHLVDAGLDASIGTVGDALDNALMESAVGLYKTELIKPRGPWRSLAEVELVQHHAAALGDRARPTRGVRIDLLRSTPPP